MLFIGSFRILSDMINVMVNIPKRVSGGDDLVVIKRNDFEMLRKRHDEVSDVLGKIRRGREECRKKKTVVVSSPHKFR